MAVATKNPEPLQLKRLERSIIDVPIEGVTPLIPHKWSEKARKMMLDKQQGKVAAAKAPKDPEADAEAATYRLADGTAGIPSVAFKAAIADAARWFDGVTMEMLKRAVFVYGEGDEQLVAIDGTETLFEAQPRNSTGVADIRFRYKIFPWNALLRVEYISSAIQPEAVLALVDAAGQGGVGDWRPSSPKSRSGTFGKWQVVAE